MKAVWHTPGEAPDTGIFCDIVLVIFRYTGGQFLVEPVRWQPKIEPWKDFVRDFQVKMWAYFKELVSSARVFLREPTVIRDEIWNGVTLVTRDELGMIIGIRPIVTPRAWYCEHGDECHGCSYCGVETPPLTCIKSPRRKPKWKRSDKL